jgi:hypothetical protein
MQADLFFIPLHARQVCFAGWYANADACGVSYGKYSGKDKVTQFWTWLAQQPSWQRSNGADHFIIAAQAYIMFTKARVLNCTIFFAARLGASSD